MPAKKKRRRHLTDLPPEKLIRKVFPKKVVDLAKKVAHEKDDSDDDSTGSKD